MKVKNPIQKNSEKFSIIFHDENIKKIKLFQKYEKSILHKLENAGKFLNGRVIDNIGESKSGYRLRVTDKGSAIRLVFLGFSNPNVIVILDIGSKKQEEIMFESVRKTYGHMSSFEQYQKEFQEKKIKNPSPTLKAQKMFEEFNHYPAEKIVNLKLPINSKTVFVKLGEIENLEYLSDKKIFASDQKTSKRKIRTYIHNFAEHGKRPMLLTNEAGNILILYDPENPIEVKPEGII